MVYLTLLNVILNDKIIKCHGGFEQLVLKCLKSNNVGFNKIITDGLNYIYSPIFLFHNITLSHSLTKNNARCGCPDGSHNYGVRHH